VGRSPQRSPGVARRVALAGTTLVAFVASAVVSSHPSAQDAGPRVPYEDIGACPFECCTYRDWTATARVTLLSDRQTGSGTAFVAQPGDRVRAITGVVITTQPGRAQVDRPVDLWTTEGTIHVVPGDTLYLLTYHGEGAFTAWFKGHLYDQVDAAMFTTVNGACASQPEKCYGRVIEKPVSEWWARVKSQKGVTGWTREPEKFSNKDRCG
jgi:hypothetical protein